MLYVKQTNITILKYNTDLTGNVLMLKKTFKIDAFIKILLIYTDVNVFPSSFGILP